MGIHISKVKIRQMIPEDIPVILDFIIREGWEFDYSEVQRILKLDPESSVVACLDREIIGGITAFSYGNRGILGHVVVREDLRRKGIGQMLMSSVLDHLDSKGIEIIEIFGEQKAARFYGRNGFRRIEDISIYIKNLKSDDFGSPSSERVMNLSRSQFEQVRALDESIIGYGRGIFIREYMNDFPDLSLGLFDGNSLIGYLQGRITSITNDIGPWIMAKPIREDSELMFHSILPYLSNKKTYVFIPSENRISEAILLNDGFSLLSKLLRLIRSEVSVKPFPAGVMALGATEFG